MRPKYNKGFTLVELIVVLAILAIVAAIAVPTAFSSLDKVHTAACEQNRHSILSLYRVLKSVHTLDAEDVTLDSVLADTYSAEIGPIAQFACKQGGVYSASASGTGLVCSAHATGVEEITIDNAKTLDELMSLQDFTTNNWSTWNEKKTGAGYTVARGTLFTYDDNGKVRYFVTNSTNLSAWELSQSPVGSANFIEVKTVYSAENTNFTPPVITGTAPQQITVAKGDAYLVGGKLYVCVQTGYNGKVELPKATNTGNWVQVYSAE